MGVGLHLGVLAEEAWEKGVSEGLRRREEGEGKNLGLKIIGYRL